MLQRSIALLRAHQRCVLPLQYFQSTGKLVTLPQFRMFSSPVPKEFVKEEASDEVNEVEDIVEENTPSEELTAAVEEKEEVADESEIQTGPRPQDLTILEKLASVTENEDGTYTHNFFKCRGDKPRTFKDLNTFKQWEKRHIYGIRKDLKQKLSPHQYYITQGGGTERAFTGEYVWNLELGIYNCAICTQRMFMSEHKYQNKSGYATFWNTIRDTVKFRDDKLEVTPVTNAHVDPTLANKEPVKRVVCSNCESHIGHVFTDGPAPFGLRFQINSASLSFWQKPWFTVPHMNSLQRRKWRKQKQRMEHGQTKVKMLMKNEKQMDMGHYKDRIAAAEKAKDAQE